MRLEADLGAVSSVEAPLHRIDTLLPAGPLFDASCTPTMRTLALSTHLLMEPPSVGFKPFMEYAGSYALFNYRLEDPAKGLDYDNLRLIRAFEHGLDASSSEAGFVLVHIAMVKESGALVEGTVEMLEGCNARDRERFDDGLRTLVQGLRNVNAVMNSELYPSV
jgi:hypothetical protein